MDNIKEIHLTPEGRQKLVDELEWREGAKNDEIVERIQEARGFGDLSENAEYDAAKEEQAKNNARINEIKQILSVAKVVDSSKSRSAKISIGCTVELESEDGKRGTFTNAGTTETNSLEHRISNESPMGAALIGRKKGEQIEFATPAGKVKKYTIVGITR